MATLLYLIQGLLPTRIYSLSTNTLSYTCLCVSMHPVVLQPGPALPFRLTVALARRAAQGAVRANHKALFRRIWELGEWQLDVLEWK